MPGPHGGITFVAAKDLPEFCRVVGVAKPSKDSEIKFEVWMPTSNWNGKFMGSATEAWRIDQLREHVGTFPGASDRLNRYRA